VTGPVGTGHGADRLTGADRSGPRRRGAPFDVEVTNEVTPSPGWVRRERHPTDRRGNVAVLSDRGWDKLVAAAPGHVATVRQGVFGPLSPEQVDQLRQIASAIQGALEAVDRPDVG
jgi:hypothetical protein